MKCIGPAATLKCPYDNEAIDGTRCKPCAIAYRASHPCQDGTLWPACRRVTGGVCPLREECCQR